MIKSSFKKVEKGTSSQKCFFGHPDLDAIFQNSLSRGHLMVIEEDHPSAYYLALCRYYLSHHYHQQGTSIVFDSSNRWASLISPPLKAESRPKEPPKQTKSEIAWRYDHMQLKGHNSLTID